MIVPLEILRMIITQCDLMASRCEFLQFRLVSKLFDQEVLLSAFSERRVVFGSRLVNAKTFPTAPREIQLKYMLFRVKQMKKMREPSCFGRLFNAALEIELQNRPGLSIQEKVQIPEEKIQEWLPLTQHGPKDSWIVAHRIGKYDAHSANIERRYRNDPEGDHGVASLCSAVMRDDVDRIRELEDEFEYIVNEFNPFLGISPLRLAIKFGSTRTISALVQDGRVVFGRRNSERLFDLLDKIVSRNEDLSERQATILRHFLPSAHDPARVLFELGQRAVWKRQTPSLQSVISFLRQWIEPPQQQKLIDRLFVIALKSRQSEHIKLFLGEVDLKQRFGFQASTALQYLIEYSRTVRFRGHEQGYNITNVDIDPDMALLRLLIEHGAEIGDPPAPTDRGYVVVLPFLAPVASVALAGHVELLRLLLETASRAGERLDASALWEWTFAVEGQVLEVFEEFGYEVQHNYEDLEVE